VSHGVKYRIVIPARFASERLPGKLLLTVAGKSVLEHTWQRAMGSNAASVLIATDDERIRRHAEGFGAEVQMTSADHQSGSDRIAECARTGQWGDDEFVVNLQGDEPLMPPACLDQVAELVSADAHTDAASLWWPIGEAQEVADPNAVKVVVDSSGIALFFSRSPLPMARDYASVATALEAGVAWRRHIGLYAYRVATLRRFASSPAGALERVEKLEQLRILEWGGKIRMARAAEPIPAGVDTQEDLARVSAIMSNNINKNV
jgi:3-deoxy-manno-octulosonate cytidylyltransferase (CMP-KDO synthetase)